MNIDRKAYEKKDKIISVLNGFKPRLMEMP